MLEPWAKRYAEWEIGQPEKDRPDVKTRKRRASTFRGKTLTPIEFANLEKNPEFLEYRLEVLGDALREGRAVLSANARDLMEQYIHGFEMAREAGDYKAMHTYLSPLVDRVWPKLDTQVQLEAPKITVQIGEGLARKLLVRGDEIVIPEDEVEMVSEPA